MGEEGERPVSVLTSSALEVSPPPPPQGAGEIFLSLTSGRACALVAAAGDGPMLQVLIEQVWAMEKCGNSIKYVFLAEDR